jgi:regulator of sigma E protease
LGHFVAARALKVEVESSALAFRRGWQPCSSRERAFPELDPLGGFVRPKGENDPSVPGIGAANPWVRLIVLVAGPMANLMVGVILYAMIFSSIGMPITTRCKSWKSHPIHPLQMPG